MDALYELHLFRGELWSEPDAPIEFAEWVELVDRSPDLAMVRRSASSTSTASPAGDVFTIWRGGPDGTAVLRFRGGRISAVRTDSTVALMLRLARELDARVQGDGREFYGEDDAD